MQVDQLHFYHRLGRILEHRRKAKGMSRRQLSEQMGDLHRSYSCYQYERGIARPSVWWLLAWCQEMETTIAEVIAEAAREEDQTQPPHAEWPEGKPP